WRDLAYAAHSLKGSAGSMGYPELTELAGKLERSANKQLPGESETLLGAMAQIISRHVPAAQ
ncbi:Hpt domain-containing protein, partial [Rheinheimera sp.]